MGYEKPDTLSLKMPRKSEAGRAAIGQTFDDFVNIARKVGKEYLIPSEAVDAQINLINEMSYDGIYKFKQFLEDGYNTMWHLPSKFRGSIEVTGDFDTDPLGCDIEFNYGKFTTPKILPTLKERTVRRTWNTKKSGTKSKTYVYPAGTKYKITGEDYSGRVPPQYIMYFLEEEKQMAIRRAGL